jgi:hypothetical protein
MPIGPTQKLTHALTAASNQIAQPAEHHHDGGSRVPS